MAIINTLRRHPGADFWGIWDAFKAEARGKVTNETIARHGLAFTGAVSMCYFAARLVQGVQSFVAYAY